jgi:hypothetical protein
MLEVDVLIAERLELAETKTRVTRCRPHRALVFG